MSGNGKGPAEVKTAAFKLTDLDFEGRTFEGYAAFFNNVDAYGDVIHPGAFVKTLVERGQKVKLLWQHDTYEPIGRPLELREDESGLFIKAIVSDTARGRDALALLQDNAINEMSIGYDAIKGGVDYTKVDDDTLRNLREIRLWEVSLVSFPANEMAQVTALKEDEAASGDKAAGAEMEGKIEKLETETEDANTAESVESNTPAEDDGVAERETPAPVLSAKGATQIGGAVSALAKALTDAGIDVPGFGAKADETEDAEPKESNSAPDESQAAIEHEQDDEQAGPDADDKSAEPPTSSEIDTLLKTIELEQATNNLLEVECG